MTDQTEWVALQTFANDEDENAPGLIEQGGVYAVRPHMNYARVPGRAFRELVPGEHVAACPRCGQRFATVEDGTAATCRDLHFDGDDDIPSICAHAETATCVHPPQVRGETVR
jgi:hypothetical protein